IYGRATKTGTFFPDEPYLLGKSSKDNAIGAIDKDGKVSFINLPWASSAIRNSYLSKNSFLKQLLETSANLQTWRDYVKLHHIKNLYDREINKEYHGEVTYEDIEELFDGQFVDAEGQPVPNIPKLDATVAKIILDHLDGNRILPYRAGTGKYSHGQVSLYTTFDGALKTGRVVTLGAKVKITRDKSIKGDSADEELSVGYVGSHAYAVTGAKMDANGKRYIKLRNPWGRHVKQELTVDELKEQGAWIIAKKSFGWIPDSWKNDPNYATITAFNKYIKSLNNKASIDSLFIDDFGLTGRVVSEIQRITKNLDPHFNRHGQAMVVVGAEFSKDEGTETGEFWAPLEDITNKFSHLDVN
ncbi:MAG: hypothetical protein AAF598_20080, partial [Bacteroidota bacterium]